MSYYNKMIVLFIASELAPAQDIGWRTAGQQLPEGVFPVAIVDFNNFRIFEIINTFDEQELKQQIAADSELTELVGEYDIAELQYIGS